MTGIGRLFGLVLLAGVTTAGVGLAQDLGGDWNLQVCVESLGKGEQVDPAGDEQCFCEYEGTTDVMGMNGPFSGPVDLSLTAGDDEFCPSMMTGTMSGSQMDGTISGTISGDLGSLDFEGSVMEAMASQSAPQQQLQGGGGFNVQQGAFTGGFGTFAAQQLPQVPTLGGKGLLLFAVILFAAGGYFLSRRRAAA